MNEYQLFTAISALEQMRDDALDNCADGEERNAIGFQCDDAIAALKGIAALEPVPDGTYLTKHGDGIISYGNGQLSVSQRAKKMVVFVGTLPDGWVLVRPRKEQPTP